VDLLVSSSLSNLFCFVLFVCLFVCVSFLLSTPLCNMIVGKTSDANSFSSQVARSSGKKFFVSLYLDCNMNLVPNPMRRMKGRTRGRRMAGRGGDSRLQSTPNTRSQPPVTSLPSQKHFQNLDRIIMGTYSKNLASVRRVDSKYNDAIVVEHYKKRWRRRAACLPRQPAPPIKG